MCLSVYVYPLSWRIRLAGRYSAFTVVAATRNAGTAVDPHVVELMAAPDNKAVSESLPLAPWS